MDMTNTNNRITVAPSHNQRVHPWIICSPSWALTVIKVLHACTTLSIIYGLLFIENLVGHVLPCLALFCIDWLYHKQQTTAIKPKFQDVTLKCDDNRNIQTHKVIPVAISHVHEGLKGRTNIHTLSSMWEGRTSTQCPWPSSESYSWIHKLSMV